MTRATARNQRPKLRLVPPPSRSNGGSGDDMQVREEKVALARRRMAEGYYDRADVLERVAEGILRQLRPAAPSRAY